MGQFTVDVNDGNFESVVVKSDIPVLVDFWAPWCGPCVAIGPVLEQLAQEYAGKIKICKMNVDENSQTPSQFGVRSIPYLVVMKEGKMVDSLLGAVPKARLVDVMNKAVTH